MENEGSFPVTFYIFLKYKTFSPVNYSFFDFNITKY